MGKRNETSMLVVWALCGIFFMAVMMLAVAGVPDITLNANQVSSQTTVDQTLGKVNLNTGLREELLTLPGVGEVMADRIIAYREEIGLFTCVEDLLNVKGIGEKMLEKLRDLVTV